MHTNAVVGVGRPSNTLPDVSPNRSAPAEEAAPGMTFAGPTRWLDRVQSSNHGTLGARTIRTATVTANMVDWESIRCP